MNQPAAQEMNTNENEETTGSEIGVQNQQATWEVQAVW